MVGPAGRQGRPGGNLQVSLFPSLCFASPVCDVGHGTIHQDEQRDLLLAKEGRNRASARGTAAEPSEPHGHYFKSCCVVTVSAKGDIRSQQDKTGVQFIFFFFLLPQITVGEVDYRFADKWFKTIVGGMKARARLLLWIKGTKKIWTDMYNAGRTLDDFKPGSGPNLPPLELEPPWSEEAGIKKKPNKLCTWSVSPQTHSEHCRAKHNSCSPPFPD